MAEARNEVIGGEKHRQCLKGKGMMIVKGLVIPFCDIVCNQVVVLGGVNLHASRNSRGRWYREWLHQHGAGAPW